MTEKTVGPFGQPNMKLKTNQKGKTEHSLNKFLSQAELPPSSKVMPGAVDMHAK